MTPHDWATIVVQVFSFAGLSAQLEALRREFKAYKAAQTIEHEAVRARIAALERAA